MIQEKKVPVPAMEFTYQIILSKGLGVLTKKSEKMIVDLANNAIRKPIYYHIPFDDKMDCLQMGMFNMFNNWKSFNPDKTDNSFAYFTEIFKRGTTEMLNQLYNKKGLKKEEQKYVRTFSINSINDGEGMFNI